MAESPFTIAARALSRQVEEDAFSELTRPRALVPYCDCAMTGPHASGCSIGGDLVPAFRVSCRKLVELLGAKAPPRRRPKRVAKKLAKRGGYMRHASMGALMWDGGVDDV